MANNVIVNIFRIPDLRKKIFFTMFILVIYRIGAHIPIPGINIDALEAFFAQMSKSGAGGFLNFFDLFSGGALKRVTIFALGIMPYISSSIIFQLLTVVVPSLEKMKKESDGAKKIQKYTKYLTVVLCVFQGFGIISWLRNTPEMPGVGRIVPADSIGFIILAVVAVTTGTMVLMWLGEMITERGVGNGISLIIFAGIVVRLPQSIAETGSRIGAKGEPIIGIIIIAVFLFVVAASILLTLGRRNIPIQYGKRQIGGRTVSAPAQNLPMPINPGNVIPIIFASSILLFPAQISNMMSVNKFSIFGRLEYYLAPGHLSYTLIYSLLVIFFCYFYSSIVFNPNDISENLKKYQGFVPGIRPGLNTAEYLSRVLNRVTLSGALFLAFIAISPDLVLQMWPEEVGQNIAYNLFGGTSLLIIVGVALDTLKQIESQLLMRHYDGFFKDVRMKSRRF
jgi:preprotein translocase subunit SecY